MKRSSVKQIYKYCFDLIERFLRFINTYHLTLLHNLDIEKRVMISSKAIVKTAYTQQKNIGIISIQSGSSIHDFAHLYSGKGFIKIGKNSTINPFCLLDGHGGGITIGNDVRIANHVTIVSSNHIFDDTTSPIYQQGLSKQGITIEDNVWIGSGARILDGVTIGTGSVIGAGSVVTKDIAANSVAMGVPARIIRQRGPKA